MRWVIDTVVIRGKGRVMLVRQALSSLTFEASSERGIMPEYWTKIVMDKGYIDGIWLSIPKVPWGFQASAKIKTLDWHFSPKEGGT